MLLFHYLIYRNDIFVEKQISKGMYNVHDLVEIKIPVHMPQIQSWPDYEPVSGQVELKGNSYNYVKLKVTHDTIFVMCVPNYRTTKLGNDNVIYAKQVSDTPLNNKGNVNVIKTFNLYTYHHSNHCLCAARPPEIVVTITNHYSVSAVPSVYLETPDQPPQFRS